ncbi:MAG: sel1 repeat family protein [Rhodospirillaceae bacterium]|nr:sel1 repeat family protein [Rhodospirillaceae bacterium]
MPNKLFATIAPVLCSILCIGVFTAFPALSGDYQEGLKMVRAGQWEAALNEFKPLADSGHAPSQFSIGLIYQLGRGVKKDADMARKMYVMSAKQGFWPAYNNLAKMFLDGDGIPQSNATAFKLFEKASENHAQAKNNLARMYENGWGVDKDMFIALRLYEESGDAGFIPSYFRLGEMFEQGLGVDKDKQAAIAWYQKAAEKNNADAAKKLKQLGG